MWLAEVMPSPLRLMMPDVLCWMMAATAAIGIVASAARALAM